MKAADTKPRFANQKTAALTLTEVLVVIAVLVVLAVLFLPRRPTIDHREADEINCINNLRQIGISYWMWRDDNDGKFPMQVSAANGGAMELVAAGNVSTVFCVMSNILDNASILVCPADAKRTSPGSFATLQNSNISYFVGLNANSNSPQTLLSGDDNLMMNGKRVQSGILNIHNGDTLAWTKERHQSAGNILFADGSVQQTVSADLTSMARLATNRLAIP